MRKLLLFVIAAIILGGLGRVESMLSVTVLALVLAIFVLAYVRRSRTPGVPQSEALDSARARARNAMKAVRKRKMTLAEASAHYGVSESAIKKMRLRWLVYVHLD